MLEGIIHDDQILGIAATVALILLLWLARKED